MKNENQKVSLSIQDVTPLNQHAFFDDNNLAANQEDEGLYTLEGFDALNLPLGGT